MENPYKLTPREFDVLQSLAKGDENADIAVALGITTGQIKKHVRQILKKMSVRNRTEAALKAVRESLV